MLWGLFMLSWGKETLLMTFQVLVSTSIAVPGFFFPSVFSYWASTQTSPMPLIVSGGSFLTRVVLMDKALKLTGVGGPVSRTGTSGRVTFHSPVGLETRSWF